MSVRANLAKLLWLVGIYSRAASTQNNSPFLEVTENINRLLSGDYSPDSLQVNGVRIGDSYLRIKRMEICNATRLGLALEQVFIHDKKSLLTKIIDTVEHDGWLHIKRGFGYRIESGRVVQFAFSHNIVSKSVIKCEASIKDILGKPDREESFWRNNSKAETEYYYEHCKMNLMWSHWNNRLDHVTVGPSYRKSELSKNL